MIHTYNIRYLFVTLLLQHSSVTGYEENWNGRWFPFGPGQVDNNPVIEEIDDQMSTMAFTDSLCDDGKTNLTVDWDGGSWAYSCFMPRRLYKPNPMFRPVLRCNHIPKSYSAVHRCMNSSISYDNVIPTYGTHRPVWARYGEYQYLPRQRWLHNLEHGAVVMLYHPCANSYEVKRLSTIVKGCLYRHVITADTFLSEARPLVLVTWGCALEMSYVHEESVREFIRTHALRGAEGTARDGGYELQLLQPARLVSDKQDSQLCPDHAPHM